MYHFNESSRDQFIMAAVGEQFITDMKYSSPAGIKIENGDMIEAPYYSMTMDVMNGFKFTKDNHIDTSVLTSYMTLAETPSSTSSAESSSLTTHPFMVKSLESSDGECSPKSFGDEDDLFETMLGSDSSCLKGVRTITRNPRKKTTTNNKSKRNNETRCGKIRHNNNKLRKSTESFLGMPKEKDRARLFNEAFDELRKRIPSIPASKKLSKIEILRLAICYMSYLKFRLEDEDPINETDDNLKNDTLQESPGISSSSCQSNANGNDGLTLNQNYTVCS